MAKYAEKTTVSSDQSRAEIERTLARYGADAFGYSTDGANVRLAFRMDGKHYRFALTMPDPRADEFNTYQQGSVTFRRADGVPQKLWEQACRQKWRALALVIKAKLEAVAAGISTVEDEFLAHTVLPDGTKAGEWIRPQLDEAYRIGAMPTQLMLEPPRR